MEKKSWLLTGLVSACVTGAAAAVSIVSLVNGMKDEKNKTDLSDTKFNEEVATYDEYDQN